MPLHGCPGEGDAIGNPASSRLKAGTHTPRPVLLEKKDNDWRANQLPLVAMGPGPRAQLRTRPGRQT